MELEILTQKENPMLNRTEVNFRIKHQGEATPKRNDVRGLIATALKSRKDVVVVDHLNTEFGTPETLGYAKVYKSVEAAMSVESKALLKRNNIGGTAKGSKGSEKEAGESGSENKEE